jgi:hypothetical protein
VIARVLLVMLGLSAADTASAQRATPLPIDDGALAVQIGAATLRGPVLDAIVARGPSVVIGASIDAGAERAALTLGGQWRQSLPLQLFVRERVEVGPTVATRRPHELTSGLLAGLCGAAGLQLGVPLGGVELLAGPAVEGVAVLSGAAPGRVVVGGEVALRVLLAPQLWLTTAGSLGQERALEGGALRGAALAGGVALGLQWAP